MSGRVSAVQWPDAVPGRALWLVPLLLFAVAFAVKMSAPGRHPAPAAGRPGTVAPAPSVAGLHFAAPLPGLRRAPRLARGEHADRPMTAPPPAATAHAPTATPSPTTTALPPVVSPAPTASAPASRPVPTAAPRVPRPVTSTPPPEPTFDSSGSFDSSG